MVSTCVDVKLYAWPGPPCTRMHTLSLFHRILSQLATMPTCPFAGRYKKQLSQSHRLQGNNRLIQRLQTWPRSLNHAHMWGEVSHQVDMGPQHPAQALTNSNKQEGHRAEPDTEHPRQNRTISLPCSNPNSRHALFHSRMQRAEQRAHLAGLRRKLLPQFVILDRNPRKQTGWELSLKWGEAT